MKTNTIKMISIMMLMFISVVSCVGGGGGGSDGDDDVYSVHAWPNGDVYYYFDSSVGEGERVSIREWMMDLEEDLQNVISFIELPNGKERTAIKICKGDRNRASIGYQSNPYLMLNSTIHVGTLYHELSHSLGLFHEWTRADRDEYGTIRMENIKEEEIKNIKKQPTLFDREACPFDIQSITFRSYGPYSFSKNGGVVLDFNWGERFYSSYFSEGDIQKILNIYGK